MTSEELKSIDGELRRLDLPGRLRWIAEHCPAEGSGAGTAGSSGARLSSSLGKEDQVITHVVATERLPIGIFTLDTGRLYEETLQVLDANRARYGVALEIETFFPEADAISRLVRDQGAFGFYQSVPNRLACCEVRKVQPLRRALAGASCWVTGLRAEQSPARGALPAAEWDADHGLLKVHPLVDWDAESIDEFVREHKVPVNALHGRNYPSIGCAPCTKAVRPGDDPRSGRWWWEQGIKECGLHVHAAEKKGETR
jgi:phosphoadenosine phosphosulfate reductase